MHTSKNINIVTIINKVSDFQCIILDLKKNKSKLDLEV